MKVSCIILCTFNDRFVKDRLIPSLLRNSDPASTEILVVDNGPEPGFEGFASESVRVIRSDPYHIPRAYNAGVAAARGRYVALFHDDCLVNDARWIEKAVSALDDQTHAVGPDLRTKRHYAYLKEVPLVMERENFLALGGYDESHYLGYQADLLCMAITDGGKRIARVEMDCVHFCIPRKGVGMSTLLFLSDADERRALRDRFAAPDFSLADMEKIVDGFKFKMRASYFFDYLVVRPTAIYLNEHYGHLPERERPSTDQLVRDGVLVKLMPSTREEMDQLVWVLDYYNRLFDRVGRISRGDG